MTMANLPALQVVIPLIAAIICAFLRHGTLAWGVSLIAAWSMPVIALTLLTEVLSGGPISYAMGGWQPPFGIEYRVDTANAFVLVLVSTIGAVVMPYARASVAQEIDRRPAGLVLHHVPAVPDRSARHRYYQ